MQNGRTQGGNVSEDAKQKLSCDHVADIRGPNGELLGSWIEVRVESKVYIECGQCGIRQGMKPSDKQNAEFLAAYRLQQQRLACPGCGEEPFLG